MTTPTQTADPSRERIVVAADELFYARGVAAVTVTEVRDLAGASLRKMYSLFPSKRDMVTAWLEHRHETWTAWFEAEISTRTAQGTTVVDAVFDALAEWLITTDHRGCGFLNTLAEHGEIDDAHRAIIRRHKADLVDAMAAHHDDPAALAVLVDGAIVRSAALGSTTPVDDARRVAHAITRHTPRLDTKDTA